MHYSSFITIATLAFGAVATSATNGEQQVQRRRLAAVMKPSLENPFGLLKRQTQGGQCGALQETCAGGTGCCPIIGGCCLDGCCNSGSYCDPDATAATEKPCICFGSDCPDDEDEDDDSIATSSSYVPTATLPAPQTSTSSRAATSTSASSNDDDDSDDDSVGIASGTSGPTPSSSSGGSVSGGSSGSSSGGSGSTSGGSASGAERTMQTVAGIAALIAAMGVAVVVM